jgi:hypothetical protein
VGTSTDIAVIGAGPVGLSIGAHLLARGADARVIGHPMDMWRNETPKGMFLKSDGFSSNIYEPSGRFTLRQYCTEFGVPYADIGMPVKATTFTDYGVEFQRRFVPTLERKKAVLIDKTRTGFRITLDSGEEFPAGKVIVTVGLSYFRYIPPEIAHLPAECRSHSAEHHTADQFKGRDVVVLGAGASATNLASLLHESGASVTMVARRRELEIHTLMELPRPWMDHLRAPLSPLGPGWRSRIYSDLPLLFRFLPEYRRLRTVRTFLGPAAGWFMRDRILGQFPTLLGYTPKHASVRPDGRVELQFSGPDGGLQTLEADHVACGTGFKVDVRKMTLLSEELRAAVRTVERTPVLTTRFESSVPGLYFAGPSAANNFGPLLRFAAGGKFAAERITPHALRQRDRRTAVRMPLTLDALSFASQPSRSG